MRTFVLLAALLPAVVYGDGSKGEMVGGYANAVVGANETALLTKALATDVLYSSAVATRVCFTTITSLQEQVVAGLNYQYTVNACPVSSAREGQGKCPSAVLASCAPREYVITVFDQPWTNTTQVSSIQPGSTTGALPKSGAIVAAASAVAVAASAFLSSFM